MGVAQVLPFGYGYLCLLLLLLQEEEEEDNGTFSPERTGISPPRGRRRRRKRITMRTMTTNKIAKMIDLLGI